MNKRFECQIVTIVLPFHFDIYLVCVKEPPHGDGSFEDPQHMFLLRNDEKFSVTHS